MDLDDDRIKELLYLGEQIKKREGGIKKMSDIRNRDWMKLDTRVSKVLRLLLEAENILMDLDDYQMENEQCYPDFEELYNKIADVRSDFTDYVDSNQELLCLDNEITNFFNNKK